MNKNKNLHKAKTAKNDEFYTQIFDIENEMNAYTFKNKDFFKGKTILLPCDDPEWSKFTVYFAQNFEFLGLKKLISTSYAPNLKNCEYKPSQLEMFSDKFDSEKSQNRGRIFTLTKDTNGDGMINIHDLEWDYLEGDGDFNSPEVTKLRDEADIIITNPPFSLFRDFIKWIGDKHFLIIGNINAITYKEVFPLIKENKIWLGATGFNGMYYKVPDNFVYTEKYKMKKEIDGVKVCFVPGTCWFTNIQHARRNEKLMLLTKKESERFFIKGGFQKYDNYDAIEVPKTKAIPSDYSGVMGVPITFLDKYNPEQFEIIGATQRGCHDDFPDTKKYNDYFETKQNGEKTGSSGVKANENAVLKGNDGKKNYFINSKGDIVQSLYQRIFIKHKNPLKS